MTSIKFLVIVSIHKSTEAVLSEFYSISIENTGSFYWFKGDGHFYFNSSLVPLFLVGHSKFKILRSNSCYYWYQRFWYTNEASGSFCFVPHGIDPLTAKNIWPQAQLWDQLFMSPYQVFLDRLYRCIFWGPHVGGEWTSGNIFIGEFHINGVLARLNRKIFDRARAILVVCARDLGFRGSLNW